MDRIALIWAAFALAAAAPQDPAPPAAPAQPSAAAPAAEPCLTDPAPGSYGRARDPAGPLDWSQCTAEEIDAAVQRQCAPEGQPGTEAYASCEYDRRPNAFDMFAAAYAEPANPPAEAPAATTWEDASRACRGQTWRRPSETVRACTERLVATDDLSQPLPQGREPTGPRCRRESVQREDGTGFRVSVTCTETTSVPARR